MTLQCIWTWINTKGYIGALTEYSFCVLGYLYLVYVMGSCRIKYFTVFIMWQYKIIWMVYLIKIWQNNGIRSDYFFSLLLLLLDALNTDISYSYMYMSLPLWTSYKDWQMCHRMIKLQTNSDLIMIFHNFAATEASKFGQLNRSVQKKEKTPSGVWICGSYGAKWTRQAPPRVRMIERERREREGGESEENEEREKEETKIFYFACFLTWWSFIEHLSETKR